MSPGRPSRKQLAIRGWLGFILFCLLGAAIVGRVLVIQSREHAHWTAVGEKFSASVRTIVPSRGQIYSHDGSVLATSVPVYDVRWDTQSQGIDWELYAETEDSLCAGLARVLGNEPGHYRQLLKTGRARESRAALVARKISYAQRQAILALPFVKEGRNESGFTFAQSEVRLKPFGDLAGRTVGIHREDGAVGLEASWNDVLAGVEGKQMQRYVIGGDWVPVSEEYIVAPRAGLDVVTTIDMHLQDVASRALERQLVKHNAKWGTVILMEVATGKIRAMANLERQGDGLDSLTRGVYREVLNRAVVESVEPGSTFKLASIMAAMEAGGAKPDDWVETGNGRVTFHGKEMTDAEVDKTGGYGRIDLQTVFARSSNVGTALTVKRCFGSEPQRFLDALHQLGVGDRTGIRLGGEPAPRVHRKVGDNGWSKLSITQMSIGYEVQQTPLQVLMLYNAVANGGRMVRPLLVESTQLNGQTVENFSPEVIRESICSKETLAAAQAMLRAVADPAGVGTGRTLFKDRPYTVAGKTGTSRVVRDGVYDGTYRASFAGYFPAEAPRYSCIVVVAETQSGVFYGGSIAGPIFQELADKVYATDPSFHADAAQAPLAAMRRNPYLLHGPKVERERLLEHWGWAFSDSARGDVDWVEAIATDSTLTLKPRAITRGVIPDVRGMGLRDALYLLENAGLTVQYNGIGSVRQQSIEPGTPCARQTISLQLR